MATNYKAQGQVLQYTCGASETVSSGDVVFVGGIPGIAIHNIAASATGSIAISGVWEVSKHNDATHGAVFALGAPVYWDSDEAEACVAAGQPLLGFAYEAAVKAGTTVKVLLAGDPKDAAIPVMAGEALAKYDLVYPSGYDANKNIIKVKKSDADGVNPLRAAWYVLPAAISDTALGIAKRKLLATGIDTDTPSVGDPVYLSDTPGGWTHEAHTTGGDTIQQVGVVTASDSSDGAILFLVGDSKAYTINTTD